MARQNAKHVGQEAAGVQHAQAVQGQQGLLATQRQGTEQRRVFGGIAHHGAARFRIFTGANKNRNIAAHGRHQRRRMQYFRTKGRHLSGFFKGDHINTFCRRYHARVGGVDTRHVRPDIHAGCLQGFAQQGCGVVAAATAQRSGAAFGLATDKALGDDNAFSQTRCQLLGGQFGNGGNVRLGTAKAVAGAQHFTHVKPQRVNVTLAQHFDKQQGRHQLTVADQLVGQGGGGGQRGGFRQGDDIFQKTLNLFADDAWIAQAAKNIELNFVQRFELRLALARFQPFSKGDQQIGDASRSGQHHQAGIRIGQHHIGAAVHGVVIGHAGTAKFGDNKTRHNNLVSGKEKSDHGTRTK